MDPLFGIIVLQFTGHPPSGSMVGIIAISSKRTYANIPHLPELPLPVPLSPQQATADSRRCRRPPNTHRQVWLSFLWGPLLLSPGSWCAQGFVCALQESLGGMGFDFNMTEPLLPSCCYFSLVLGCQVSFFGGFQHSPVKDCSAATCKFGTLTAENECTSFYSVILAWVHFTC